MEVGGIADTMGNAAFSLGSGLNYLLNSGGEKEYQRAVATLQELQRPDFKWSDVQPEDLQAIKQYFPQTWQNAVPDQVKVAADSPQLQAQQQDALNQWGQISQTGFRDSDRIAAEEAQQAARNAHQQAVQSSMRALQSRGMAGGGAEIAARAAAGQQAANLAHDQSNDLARQAVQNRMMGLQQAGQLAGDIRQQNYGIQQDQANTLNNWNRWLAQYNTAPQQYLAQAQNAAGMAGWQNQQRVQDYNAMNRQATNEANLGRRMDYSKYQSDWDLNRAAALSGQQANFAARNDKDRAAQSGVIGGLSKAASDVGNIFAGLF